MDSRALNPHVLASFDVLIAAMTQRVSRVKKVERLELLKAAQAIAVIAMADQILASMPVEIALEYRQMAKEFNKELNLMPDDGPRQS